MRIAIDARALSHPQPGGFKSYTTNLVRALLEQDRENQYLLYLDRPLANGARHELANATQHVVRSVPGWASVPWREQVVLPSLVARQRPDMMHLPCATGPLVSSTPLVVTIHDTIELQQPAPRAGASRTDLRRWLMGRYSAFVLRRLARRSNAIITVSHHARGYITALLQVPTEKIRVIHAAHSASFRPVRDLDLMMSLWDRYRLPRTFTLSIASASRRKNLSGLLRVYRRLPDSLRNQYPLVVVWTHARLQEPARQEVERLGLQRSVQFLSAVPDSDLVLLYNAATIFVFPSLHEGFGLPVLEAMACGTPVVASSLTSVPEVAGDGALLIDPRDEQAFAETLGTLLTDPHERARLSRTALDRARQFSWERAARQTLDVYREVGATR